MTPTISNTARVQRAERVRLLRRLDACAVSDALDRLGLQGVESNVPQSSGNGRVAGAVVTLSVGTGSPPAGPPRHLGTAAIEAAGSDHVIVIEQSTGIDAGCWGGLLTLAAHLRGVAGVIADGPVRDVDEARGLGFAIYARKLTARTARGRVVELGTNIPIRPWGHPVSPEDYVIADSSGVVFIPAADIDRVLEAAGRIAARESSMADALRAGGLPSAVLGGGYESMLER